jgi:hypothetical protein
MKTDEMKYLEKFHRKAANLEKNDLSPIDAITTSYGVFAGFTFVENNNLIKIFLDDADVLIQEGDDEPHEIGLYELN